MIWIDTLEEDVVKKDKVSSSIEYDKIDSIEYDYKNNIWWCEEIENRGKRINSIKAVNNSGITFFFYWADVRVQPIPFMKYFKKSPTF